MRLHGSTDSETDGSENRGQGGAVHEDLLSESGLEYPVYSRIRIVEIPKERCEASVGADAEASTLQWRFTLCARRDNFGRRDVGSYHGLALFSLRWRRGRLFSTHLALPTGLLTVRDVSAFFCPDRFQTEVRGALRVEPPGCGQGFHRPAGSQQHL